MTDATTQPVPRVTTQLAARRQSGARAVYEHLRDQIITGDLAPAERITEPVLAARLGVSRTPVREALRLLQAEALVEELATGGVRVAPLDADDLERVYDVRSRLEGLLAHDAAERATPDDVAALDRLVDLMDRVRDDEAEVLRIGAEFHARIETVAGNAWCSVLLRQIRGHVDRYRVLAAHGRVGGSAHVDEHRAVAAAIAAGDPENAEAVMRAHIEHSAATAERTLADPAISTRRPADPSPPTADPAISTRRPGDRGR
ncbi:GntR family transcriptional regulator [Sediminihabitans luteus]|uniref:GntR family transcriptional regulator n=1 Tax=Sediminihabitans luteus TaxID=1138585 RepID=UPI001951E7D8|nr:GntR family transcriptional regulator [Sediminihabitans luteus]GII97786.1 GntR family transcriptional regulator [Sediminihabitans luteus]